MGYQTSLEDTGAPPPIELRSISKRDFELMRPFAYRPKAGATILVPAHPNAYAPSTDLASVPPLLWGLLPSYGRQLRAALLHDHLCDVVNKALRDGAAPEDVYPQRKLADDLFFEAMRDTSAGGDRKRIGWFRAKLFWIGVSYGRYWKLRKARALVMTLQVLAGVLAMNVLWRLPPLRWLARLVPGTWATDWHLLLGVWIAATALSVAWWQDYQIPMIGLVAGPFILPVLLVTFVVQFFLGLPDQLLHVVRKDQPVGDFGPAVAAARDAVRPPAGA
jgi:hypothetical protein